MTLRPALRRLSGEHRRWRAEEEVLLPELTHRVSEAAALVVFTLGDQMVLRRLVRELRAAGHQGRAAPAGDLAPRRPQGPP